MAQREHRDLLQGWAGAGKSRAAASKRLTHGGERFGDQTPQDAPGDDFSLLEHCASPKEGPRCSNKAKTPGSASGR